MGSTVIAAQQTFFSDKSWVYGTPLGGAGRWGDGNNRADCTYFTYLSARNAGYAVDRLATSELFVKDAQGKWGLSAKASQYYEVVSTDQAHAGDFVFFQKAAQNSNHVMVLSDWNGSNGSAMGAQSTDTGVTQDISIGGPRDYWGNASGAPSLFYRPRADTYVAALDQSSPTGGLQSEAIGLAVNLLKQPTVEGFRENIYVGAMDGVPTIGNGFALVVKGDKGVWAVRDMSEIEGLLRQAGLPQDTFSGLPAATLQRAAELLNAGDKAGVVTLFRNNPAELTLSETAADRLTGAEQKGSASIDFLAH